MHKQMPVSRIMTREVITLHPEDSMNIVEETFAAKPFHHIPIADTHGHVVGMVSKTDLLQLSAIKKDLSDQEYKFLKVKYFMTSNLVTVDTDTAIQRAAELFYDNKFHALPVIENDRIVGIVTTHDLLKIAFDLIEVS
ncbi:MAG: CBS domain-containing protein [Saprospiraceae bacterium]|nr:CBS domain-containing protein [Saprospiraceae bacterium]